MPSIFTKRGDRWRRRWELDDDDADTDADADPDDEIDDSKFATCCIRRSRTML